MIWSALCRITEPMTRRMRLCAHCWYSAAISAPNLQPVEERAVDGEAHIEGPLVQPHLRAEARCEAQQHLLGEGKGRRQRTVCLAGYGECNGSIGRKGRQLRLGAT